jgi:hypothetical protein
MFFAPPPLFGHNDRNQRDMPAEKSVGKITISKA